MDKLLKLLDSNARLTDEQLATMLNMSKEEVRAQISKLEIPGGLQRLLDFAVHTPERAHLFRMDGLIGGECFAYANVGHVRGKAFAEGRLALVLQQQALRAAAGTEHFIKKVQQTTVIQIRVGDHNPFVHAVPIRQE